MTRIDVTSLEVTLALRTAVEKGEGTLDKGPTSHDNLFDASLILLGSWLIPFCGLGQLQPLVISEISS
ncbi:MAG: hypothetical protein ACRD47_16085 [Nitrososphaeraceae archaeon]